MANTVPLEVRVTSNAKILHDALVEILERTKREKARDYKAALAGGVLEIHDIANTALAEYESKSECGGNATVLRTALEGLFRAYANLKCPSSVCDKCNEVCHVNDAWIAAQKALETPARNCDMFNDPDKALMAFADWFSSLPSKEKFFSVSRVPFVWLFDKAKKGGTK